MEVPGRRILKQYSLEINVLAVDELYHHRTDETLYGLGLLFGHGFEFGYAVFAFAYFLAVDIVLRGIPDVVVHKDSARLDLASPLRRCHLVTFHLTPCRAIAVDHAVACDGDVFEIFAIDRRYCPIGFIALVDGINCRIQVRVRGKEYQSAAIEVQVDV